MGEGLVGKGLGIGIGHREADRADTACRHRCPGHDRGAVEGEHRLVGGVVGQRQALAVDGIRGVGLVNAAVLDTQGRFVGGRNVRGPFSQRDGGVLVG